MNPPGPRHDDEQFMFLLARYSEALAAGSDAGPLTDAALSPEMRQRLQHALDCLHQFPLRPDPQTIPYSAVDPPTLVRPPDITLQDGESRRQVGRFRILRTLGHGGGGIVFLAFDPELRREVALKVPRLEALLSPELRRRFLREARAAAGLNHPNLVPVYEAGEADGLCFIISAYCPGSNLAEWLAQGKTAVPVRLAAELTAVLADAVRYIHERGIYHRDIKPSNILLDPNGARPTGEPGFTPRLTDFGLAKLPGGQTDATRSGAMMGTAPYMAPEQVEGRLRDIGPRTDVYGLGAVLYELLTRQPPFRSVTDADTLRQVLVNEPEPLRSQRRDVPCDLEIICLKCLEKEPARRYASAAELADDLHRFLAFEPIHARPPGRIERLGKWVRRRPASAVLFGASLLLTLCLLISGIGLGAMNHARDADRAAAAIQDQRRQEEMWRQEDRARQERCRLLYANDINRAWRNWCDGRHDQVIEQLAAYRPSPCPNDRSDLRGFEWRYLMTRPPRRLIENITALYCAAFSPDSTTCVSGHDDGSIRLWDPVLGRRRGICKEHKGAIYALAYSPDGKFLASGGGTASDAVVEGELLLWDAVTLKLLHRFPGLPGPIDSLAISPDGLTLAAVSHDLKAGGEVKIWAIPSGMERATIPFPGQGAVSLVFSSDNATLIVGHADGRLSLCDPRSGRLIESWHAHQRCIWSVASTHKNGLLASASYDGAVRLWRVQSADRWVEEYRHESEVWGVAFSPDDRSVASVGRDGVVKLWDREQHCVRFSLRLPDARGRVVTFSPNGQTLAVGVQDGRLWMCDVTRSAERLSWLAHQEGAEPREAWAIAFSGDGKTLASAGDDHMVRLWDPATGQERAVLRGHESLVSCLAYSPDGKWLASGSFDEQATVKLWDTTTGAEVATLRGHTKPVYALAFAPDGKLLATAGRDHVVRLWDVTTAKERQVIKGHNIQSLAFSPDGRTLALTSNVQVAFVWDIATEKVCLTLPPHPGGTVAVAFSPNANILATGDTQGTVYFWDAASADLRASIRSHTGPVNCLAFTPDGKTLASASFDRTVKLWQTSTGRELLTLAEHADRVRWVTFSGDGRSLATAGHDGVLKIYRVPANDQQPSLLP